MYKRLRQNSEKLALDALAFAKRLEERAMNAPNMQGLPTFSDPAVLYNMAYNVYQTVAECQENQLHIRGQAAFQLWNLAQDNRVFLQPTQTETKEQRMQSFLIWAAECGCIQAQEVLKQRSVNYVPQTGTNSLRNGLGI